MKSIFKRFVIIFAVILMVGLTLLLVIARVFEEQIGENVISAINEQIKTELRVNHFELSILRSFPTIGANLKGVEIDGTDKQLLIQVDEISLRASLFSFFREKMEVKSVVVADGRISITYDKDGQSNFDILEETEATEKETSSGIIDLQNTIFRNIEIDYQDDRLDNDLLLYVDQATFSGAFSSEQFDLKSKAKIQMALLKIDGEHLMGGQNIVYDIGVHINTAKGIYKFEQFNLQLGKLPLQANGQIEEKGDGYKVDLKLESDGGQLADFINLLPKKHKTLLEGLESRGKFGLKANILGLYTDKKMPEIKIDLSFENGRLSSDRIHAPIRDLSFFAQYTNGARKNNSTSILNIQDFKGQFDGEVFTMDLVIENFDHPSIDLNADGKLAVGALLTFIPDERITDGEGMISLNNLKLKGRFGDMMRSSKASRVELSGEISVDKASLTINGEDIRLNRGSILLQGNDISISDLELKAPGTELVFNGRAVNLLPVIFADSVNSKSSEFIFDVTLEASALDIDALLAFGMPAVDVIKEAEEVGQSDSLMQQEIEKRAYFAQFLNGTFNARIQQFNYHKIEGENFEGELIFDAEKMTIIGRTEAMGGNFELDAELLFTKKPSLEAKFSCNQIQAALFLEQFENFNQYFLVAENLEGTMDGRFFIQCSWDENGDFVDKDLHLLGGIGIHDGVLKDFAMLEDFSSFVDIRDLRKIHFTNLENFFEIKNNTFYLPVMFIQSNAINLTISGQHTMEQDIAYFVKVNAGQVMMNKFRSHNRALNPKPSRRNGFFNLHYAILGDIDDYTFSSDKKRVQRDFEESELRKRDIHFALEKALGTVIEFVEEPLDWRDIQEYEEDPDSTDPEFLDMDIEGGY